MTSTDLPTALPLQDGQARRERPSVSFDSAPGATVTSLEGWRLPWLVCEVLAALLAFDIMGLGRNFSKMYGLVSDWKVQAQRAPGGALVELVCQAVNWACVWYPRRVRCLQRSAVTTCVLRSHGVPAVMVMGAQTVPFKAHAWAEVNGQAVNERRDVQRIYSVWERC
jgi:Transglutaminase-like superfamily